MPIFRINLLVEAPEGADAEDVSDFLEDLTWVGGCRDPDNDPMFSSVEILEKKVSRGRRTTRANE